MSIEHVMEEYGFRLSAGCSGKASYVKNIKHDGNRAYLSVTVPDGEGMPTTLEEPVLVTIYDLKSGEPLEEGQDFDSLSEYLEIVKYA
jgi:hypothetical protein